MLWSVVRLDKRSASITAFLKPIVAAMDLTLWGCVYLSQGKHSVLKVFIDRPTGVSAEDCASVHRQVVSVLAVEEMIRGDYRLEVSSPGVERQLFEQAQFEDYIGDTVAIQTKVPIAGQRNFKGVLKAVVETGITLEMEDANSTELLWQQVEKANVVMTW